VPRFSSRNVSRADVPAPRQMIWDVLTDPDALAELTPLLDGITMDGEHWCWQLGGIRSLGVEVAPSFTERMVFEPPSRIAFHHDPPPGAAERAGAEGVYDLIERSAEATQLSIDISLHVELPLPAMSRRAVERVMHSTMARTGEVFAQRLYRRLGIDPDTVIIDPAVATPDPIGA
jgi:carbon monoxide dehydrogenase subunit G